MGNGVLPLVNGVLAGSPDLAAASQLLHGFGFDLVELEMPKLSYEPRWSCQCKACAAAWVASKSGAVMRIGLSTASGRPEQKWFPGDREARTIYHQHDGTALGGGSFLLIGRDEGTLDIISDRHRDWADLPGGRRSQGPPVSFHLDSWWATGSEVPVHQGFERAHVAGPKYTMGITAIAVLPRPGAPGTLDILVATRYPWLYVIEAANGRMQPRRRLAMPGWIQWILGPPDDDRVACISRGGDIVRFSGDELRDGGEGKRTELPLLPTAAMPFGAGSVLLGTTTGLFLVTDDRPEGIAVPVTRSPVLCLDRVIVESHGDRRDYVAMGLQDGRLRVADADLLRCLASGSERPETGTHNFAVDLGDAVLAVETLRPDAGPCDAAYVLAVLRDHSVRLFHVTSLHALQARAACLWSKHVSDLAGTGWDDGSADRIAAELRAARARPRNGDANAWKSMLIDVVLPRLRRITAPGSAEQRAIVELACEMAAGADRLVLRRLSVALGQLAGDDVGLILELSRSILRAVPHGNDRRWWTFIDSHLRDLNALARNTDEHDRARLVGWTRLVRKYILLGNTFAAKQFGLSELVEHNYETHKYLDALIYQTRLSQRCYDLRWESHIGDEVSEVHVVDCGAGRTLVTAAAVDGSLVFLDGATGRKLGIRCGAEVLAGLAPFGQGALARTLACAVALENDVLRVVLSCTGADAPSPGLAVCDVRWSGVDTRTVELVEVSRVACADPFDPHAQHARVYVLQPLPGRPNAFVAGLETRASPIGLVSGRPGPWTLKLTKDDAPTDRPEPDGSSSPVERRSLAPGKMPTRAIAVAAVDDLAARYLVVTGSDDGLVCAISFGWGDAVRQWKVRRWDRLTDAVTSIVLGRHRRHAALDPDESLFSCYLGTTAGDTFALSIVTRRTAGARTADLPFGDYDARPLWRDTHDGPILALRLWRTPLFPSDAVPSDEVLVVATEPGRLSAYNHSPDAGGRVSASSNYYFRGMRFDRIAMPGRLRALSMLEGGREFVAAGSGGRLYMGKLMYLRDSVDRVDPEQREQREPRPGHKLPDEGWARLHQLFAASRHDEPFEVDPARRDDLKLELCELIRLEGGPLSAYALRERLLFHERWDDLDAEALSGKARRLLHALDPENQEDAERIKVILKSLCRTFLHRHPRHLITEILTEAQPPVPDWRARTAITCEVVSDYLTRDLTHSTRAAARLRIVAIKELLRVPALRQMAHDDHEGTRVRAAVESALDSCLRDDDRLVRIEALRAVSVVLRNVGVMADEALRDRRSLLDALFPRGLGSVTWILKLIVEGLQRFPSFRRRTALVSAAWYHISALLPLFRIFPDRTLALCDYLIRAGLGVDVVAMCARSLRRQRTVAIRSRIEHLYLLPAPDRDSFIERYDRNKPSHQLLLKEIGLTPRPTLATEWHQIDDAAMAHRLTELLDHLARMWSVRHREQIDPKLAMFQPATPDPEAPLASLERVVAELASVAGDLASVDRDPATRNADEVRALERLLVLGEQYGSSDAQGSAVTAPIRAIVSGIVAAWLEVYHPPLADRGTWIGRYQLGSRISEGGFGSLFDLHEPRELRTTHVIKVLRRLNAPNAATRFLEGARFNRQLCERSNDKQYIVAVTDIVDKRPYLAYVMPRYRRALEEYLTPDFHNGPSVLAWTEKVAEHIARALRATHDGGRCHGDVKPTNILVREDKDPIFLLGDFDLAYASEDTILDSLEHVVVVPTCLSRKHVGDDTFGRRQWDDIAALSLILYRMLTGTTIDPRKTDDLDKHLAELRKLANEARIANHLPAQRIVEALICIFEPGYRALDIGEFLSWIAVPPPPPEPSRAAASPEILPRRPTRPPRQASSRDVILFLAASPVGDSAGGTSPLALYEECAAIERELGIAKNRGDFVFHSKWAASVDDVMRHLNELQPTIIHFSGHGGGTADVYIPDGRPPPPGIQLQDEQRPQYVGSRALTRMIAAAAPSARVVVLNACFSDEMASQLCGVVDCVVGMRSASGVDAARSFAVAFYQALGFRKSVGNAVAQASATLMGKRYPEEHGPVCQVRMGFDPDKILLASAEAQASGTFPPDTSQSVRDRVTRMVARSATAAGRDLHLSEMKFYSGRGLIDDWKREVIRSGWNEPAWRLLGRALRFTHEAIAAEPNLQHAWTLLADIYYRIGQIELALECLRRSYELATPGPRHPGGYYKYVEGSIHGGYPFGDAGGLERKSPPSSFTEEYRRYLDE